MSGASTTKASAPSRKDKGIRALLRELSDDEEDIVVDTRLDVPDDPQRPWLQDFRAYLDIFEQVPGGWTAIQWWGVSVLFIECLDKQLTQVHSTTHSAITLRGAPSRETIWQ